MLNLVLKYLLKKYIPKESMQKSTSSGFSKIDSLKKIRSTKITDPIAKYKYSDIL